MEKLAVTAKTRIRRGPNRAVFDREMLYQIFDQAHIAHIGFSMDEQSFVIPMLCWRQGNTLYIHGSNGSRMIKALTETQNCCVTATLLDGMVLAKSAFSHSTNYRSACVFGQFRQLVDPNEINQVLEIFMQHIAPGRWQEVRPPNQKELKATTILAIEMDEASVKVRSGGPADDEADLDFPVWSGELVIKQTTGKMVADAHTPSATKTPDYSQAWQHNWELLPTKIQGH